MDYCIIGNGIAGISAARATRDKDPAGRITVLGEETVLPYNRILLSKKLLGTLQADTMLLQSREWYGQMRITLHNSSRAVRLDLDNHQVICTDGQTLSYDRLLMATGARNRMPPVAGIESAGVYSIRQLADIEKMNEPLTKSTKVVLIGGGIQNLETAWTLVQKGKSVVLVEAALRLMPRLLDEEASRMLLQALSNAGVQVFLGAWMERIDPGKPLECVLSSGEVLKGDVVIYATGIVPNADLAVGTALLTGEGIGVDDQLRTRVPQVFAAGDVTQCQGMVCGLWNTAAVQGRVAGLNMTGVNEKYVPVLPVTTLNAFGMRLFSMGQPFVREGGWTLTEQDAGINSYVRVFGEEQYLVGAVILNQRSVIPVLRKGLEHKDSQVMVGEKPENLAALLKILA